MKSTLEINNTEVQTAKTQAEITPAIALDILKQGNARFLENDPAPRNLHDQVTATATGQYPFAAVLSCIDSRIPTEIILDQGIGDIFNARIAGNFVNGDILGSLEFACKVAGAKLIVVMGHTSCGAVKGACDNVKMGNLTATLSNIRLVIDQMNIAAGEDTSSKNGEFVQRVSENNVAFTIERIKAQSPILAELVLEDKLMIVGAMYDVASGKVTFYDN
ncbi:MAG: carbonic anhydrase family protein [Cyclobacteriaceae bacterium]|nr:carbonic anhydrase family protein [Cyclobacteriaceae bacterium]